MAFAFDGIEKSQVKIQFNNKIDSTIDNQGSLEKEMADIYGTENKDDTLFDGKNNEDQTVADFIDYEIHQGGRADKLVDRRMNSTEEPIVASPVELLN